MHVSYIFSKLIAIVCITHSISDSDLTCGLIDGNGFSITIWEFWLPVYTRAIKIEVSENVLKLCLIIKLSVHVIRPLALLAR